MICCVKIDAGTEPALLVGAYTEQRDTMRNMPTGQLFLQKPTSKGPSVSTKN